MDLFRNWIMIFALVFAIGVVSGIVMSYQFGTNWAVFSDRANPIIGPLMAYEVLTAFFSESRFFGRDAVWPEPGRQGAALHRHADGGIRYFRVFVLDSVGQQLDAHAHRLRCERGGPVHFGGKLERHHFQPEFPLLAGAYLVGCLPDHCLDAAGCCKARAPCASCSIAVALAIYRVLFLCNVPASACPFQQVSQRPPRSWVRVRPRPALAAPAEWACPFHQLADRAN